MTSSNCEKSCSKAFIAAATRTSCILVRRIQDKARVQPEFFGSESRDGL